MGGFGQAFDDRASALAAAQQLINTINNYLITALDLPELDRGTLSGLVTSLNNQVMYGTSDSIQEAVAAAQATFNAIAGQSGTGTFPTPAPSFDPGLFPSATPVPEADPTETPDAG